MQNLAVRYGEIFSCQSRTACSHYQGRLLRAQNHHSRELNNIREGLPEDRLRKASCPLAKCFTVQRKTVSSFAALQNRLVLKVALRWFAKRLA